ncbi:MAG: PEP-utilizing enzyme [Candidatus Moranbacteria bacterium]|nr:PEP-utilizing enzyme [Candidatus Moranbacteria bacterium]
MSKLEWRKNWSGSWSFLECFYYGKIYTILLEKTHGIGISTAAFISKQGRSDSYLIEDEVAQFGEALAKKLEGDINLAEQWGQSAKEIGDRILQFIEFHQEKEITPQLYNDLWDIVEQYAVVALSIKVVGDYLPTHLSKKLLPLFSEIREYGEPVYTQSALFIKKFANQVSEITSIPAQYVLASTDSEINEYFETQKLPDVKVLAARYECAFIYVQEGEIKEITGKEGVDAFEKQLRVESEYVQGACAFPGKVKGKVRIILDPSGVSSLEAGTVLVTGMTRPEYLHLMKQAIAVVTDGGGVLSHAAITARELKKPCIIGTKIATQVLKDGDMVEVDAERGIITIIK